MLFGALGLLAAGEPPTLCAPQQDCSSLNAFQPRLELEQVRASLDTVVLVRTGSLVWLRFVSRGSRFRDVRGTVTRLAGDTIIVRPPASAAEVAATRAQLSQLLVSIGTRRSTGRGAAIGVGIGVAVGVFVGLVGYKSDELFSQGERIAGLGLVAGLGGLVVGAVMGSTTSHESWQPARLWSNSSSPPTGYRIGIRLSVRLNSRDGSGAR